MVKSSASNLPTSLDKVVKLARRGQTLGANWCELAAKPLTDSDAKDLWGKIDAKLQEAAET